MQYNSEIHHRKSIRLKYYNYSREGAYFITICIKNRLNLLGNITNAKIELNNYGRTVEKEIIETNKIRKNVKINEYIIMPNHVHLIIEISETLNYEQGVCNTPLQTPAKTIGAIIKGIKSATSRQIGYSIWQRNYYEHIIRNEKEYYKIVEYIQNNPLKWEEDEYFEKERK